MNKKPKLDINNMNEKQRKNDHMFSDILGGSASVRSHKGKKAGDLVIATNDWQTADLK